MLPRLLILFLSLHFPLYALDSEARPPKNNQELESWLQNMIWFHHFTSDEIQKATGLSSDEIKQAQAKFNIYPGTEPKQNAASTLLVLPYPGGRHPRIGFLEGAVNPQRETKLSIFTPWDENSYIVADVPEAIWSNLGLTYLAHTHVPTIWSRQNILLPHLEWTRLQNGDYKMERTLPNGIRFGTLAHPATNALIMKMWLFNGAPQPLSDLRVQQCVMLKAASGFDLQTNTNKIFRPPFAAVHSADRWIIEAWKPIQRAWGNAPVPCLHADPKFPDTPPGQTNFIHGQIIFYTGRDIDSEFKRIDSEWDQNVKQLGSSN